MPDPVFYFHPDGDFMADIVATRLRNEGHEVVQASALDPDGNAAQLREGHFTVAVLDSANPDAFGVAAMIKRKAPATRVLMLLTPDNERPTDFRFGGDANLVEPFEVGDVVTAVKELEPMTGCTVAIAFPTSDENVERARTTLTQMLEGVQNLDEATAFHLSVAFGEAVGNAALHGNRSRRDRLVRLLWYHDDNGLTLRVTDEGPGFDWKGQMAQRAEGNAIELARERQDQGKLGGLGMNTMQKVCDLVKYNDEGNEVTLMKVLTPPLV